MARFSGLVGYVTQEENDSYVWVPVERSRLMKGDVIHQVSRYEKGDKVNDDVILNHRISLIGDAYAFGNYFNIKWVEMDGIQWKVTSIEIKRPRIIVSLGGVWIGSEE